MKWWTPIDDFNAVRVFPMLEVLQVIVSKSLMTGKKATQSKNYGLIALSSLTIGLGVLSSSLQVVAEKPSHSLDVYCKQL